ncbi:MAG: nicotinate (nicotinamide) nucleotide adenylyltransferase [Planctomycetota bacterium]
MPPDLASCPLVLVYGGTFDPPHTAHVRQPDRVRRAINADAVIYMPAAVSPHKQHLEQTPPDHRLAMLRLATADQPWAIVRTDELDRAARDGKPSYTVDTLEALRAELPDTTRLRLLIGADQLRAFHDWYRADRIVELAEPLVMVRPPDKVRTVLNALPQEQRATWRPRLVSIEPMDVSSTAIRTAIRTGAPTAGLINPAVADYIRDHGLYHDTPAAAGT